MRIVKAAKATVSVVAGLIPGIAIGATTIAANALLHVGHIPVSIAKGLGHACMGNFAEAKEDFKTAGKKLFGLPLLALAAPSTLVGACCSTSAKIYHGLTRPDTSLSPLQRVGFAIPSIASESMHMTNDIADTVRSLPSNTVRACYNGYVSARRSLDPSFTGEKATYKVPYCFRASPWETALNDRLYMSRTIARICNQSGDTPADLRETVRIPENLPENVKLFLEKAGEQYRAAEQQYGRRGAYDDYFRLMGEMQPIFDRMQQSEDFTRKIDHIADEYLTNCADRKAVGFVKMQAAMRRPNGPLSEMDAATLFEYARGEAILEHLDKKSIQSIEARHNEAEAAETRATDALTAEAPNAEALATEAQTARERAISAEKEGVEIYLAYVKNTLEKDGINLDVKVPDMIHRRSAQVEAQELEDAYTEIRTPQQQADLVYRYMYHNKELRTAPCIDKLIEAVSEEDRFDTCPLSGEAEGAYKARLDAMPRQLEEACVQKIKEHFERALPTQQTPLEETEVVMDMRPESKRWPPPSAPTMVRSEPAPTEHDGPQWATLISDRRADSPERPSSPHTEASAQEHATLPYAVQTSSPPLSPLALHSRERSGFDSVMAVG